jgi:hypothetical protein
VLLWGDADRFFPIDLAHRLREAFPNAVLIEIPGGRLFFPLDVPQRVADQIESRYERMEDSNADEPARPHTRWALRGIPRRRNAQQTQKHPIRPEI